MAALFSIPPSFHATSWIVESKKTLSMDCWVKAQTKSSQCLRASSTPSVKEIASCSTNSIAWSRKRKENCGTANVRVSWHCFSPCFTAHHQCDCDDGRRGFWAPVQTVALEMFGTHSR